MKKTERIEALEIASKYEIHVAICWWSPIQDVTWKVLKSRKKLTIDQYYYLSRNKFIEEKKAVDESASVFSISSSGKEKLLSLKSK